MIFKNKTLRFIIFLISALGIALAAYLYFRPAPDFSPASLPGKSQPSEKTKPTDSQSPADKAPPIQPPVEREEIKSIKSDAEALIEKIDRQLSEMGVNPSEILKADEKNQKRRRAEMDKLKQRLENIQKTEPEK